MRRYREDSGSEIRVVALTTFLSVIGSMCSALCLVTGLWLGASSERNALLERIETRFQPRSEAKAIHDNLSERLADTNIEIGKVRGRLEAHLDQFRH